MKDPVYRYFVTLFDQQDQPQEGVWVVAPDETVAKLRACKALGISFKVNAHRLQARKIGGRMSS